MAKCPACRASLHRSLITTLSLPWSQQTIAIRSSRQVSPFHSSSTRSATSANASKYRRADRATSSKSKKKGNESFKSPDLTEIEQYSLCDAMRYIRAFEVGQDPTSPKYTLSIRMKTLKNGPVIRNLFRLPHPISGKNRIAVICPPDSKAAKEAVANGAVLVGEETIIDAVKEGRVEFERCLAHADSMQKVNKSGIARILGPRGLMPSTKRGTVTRDVGARMKDMQGGVEYRERLGVVRIAIGQLGFAPEEMQANIMATMQSIKKDVGDLSDKINKEVHEVVLSSTHSPGFSLNGEFRSPQSLPSSELSVL